MIITKIRGIYYFLLSSLFASILLVFLGYMIIIPGRENVTYADNDRSEFPQGYRIISPQIPGTMTFAGENAPVDNFEVYERADREFITNTYWHSYTLLSIKRAARWFPVIEPILEKNGIPDDFKYVALIESGLANVISPAGATGFWQFLEGTALEYGLEVSSEVDERYDVEKSTEAACRYLWNAYSRFGSWTLAAAAYNLGMDGVARQLNRQKTNNYYNLVLGEETSRYIFRVLALKEILRYPESYGFQIDETMLYPPLKTYEETVSWSISDLADYAIQRGYNYKILKYYNPWLRDTILSNNAGKIYRIKFPEEGSITIIRE